MFSSLIRPPKQEICEFGEVRYAYADSFITGLTGITNEMLEDAPGPEEIPSEGPCLFGRSGPFGTQCTVRCEFFFMMPLNNGLGRPLRNDFLDTLRLSRKLLPELPTIGFPTRRLRWEFVMRAPTGQRRTAASPTAAI